MRRVSGGAGGGGVVAAVTPAEFRALLTWRMVSDPWPPQVDVFEIDAMLDREARERGYADWVDAYHEVEAA